MNTLTALLAAAGSLPSTSALISLFVYVAIAVLVVWGVIALVKWSGWVIPQPVWIVLTVLGGIFLIVMIARFFGVMS